MASNPAGGSSPSDQPPMTVTRVGSQGVTLGGVVSATPMRAWPAQGAGCSAVAPGAGTSGATAGSRVVPTAFGRAAVPAVPLASARGAAPAAPQLHSARPAAAAPASFAPQPVAQAAGAAAHVPQFRAQVSDLGVAAALAPPASARAHLRATDLGRAAAQAPPTPARAAQAQAAPVAAPTRGAALSHMVAPSPSAAPATARSAQQHLGSTAASGLLGLGARVEALYEGRWYAGDLAGCPEDDEEQLGRWAVKCDVDPPGVYAYVMDVRPLASAAAAATSAATAAASAAAASWEPPIPGGGRPAAASWEPTVPGGDASDAAWDGDAANVIVTKAFLADGNEYFMVCDPDGNELGSFHAARHLEFELNAGPEPLQRWLQSLSTPLLPGLLALLVEATEDRGKQLAEAKERRDALHSPEDYHFFGLSPDCGDQELERAYRRLCARLHPDKGGDEAAFAAMRQRYDRLKSLRARGGAPGGGAAGAGSAGGGAADAEGDAEAGGRRGEISWDPRDRASMLQAHEDLRLQLLWIAEQTDKVERDIADLRRRQETRYCLADRPPAAATAAENADAESGLDAAGVASAAAAGSGDYVAPSGAHARHDFGTCMLCLEPIPADPRLVVNLCCADPPCQCLLHVRCFLDRAQGMNDHLRRCMICRRPSDPELVRRAVQARERSFP